MNIFSSSKNVTESLSCDNECFTSRGLASKRNKIEVGSRRYTSNLLAGFWTMFISVQSCAFIPRGGGGLGWVGVRWMGRCVDGLFVPWFIPFLRFFMYVGSKSLSPCEGIHRWPVDSLHKGKSVSTPWRHHSHVFPPCLSTDALWLPTLLQAYQFSLSLATSRIPSRCSFPPSSSCTASDCFSGWPLGYARLQRTAHHQWVTKLTQYQHWARDKIADILQAFSNSFSYMKIGVFIFKLCRNLFTMVYLTIRLLWFR